MKFSNLLFASALLIGLASCNKSDSAKGNGPDTLPPIATPGAPTPEPAIPKNPQNEI